MLTLPFNEKFCNFYYIGFLLAFFIFICNFILCFYIGLMVKLTSLLAYTDICCLYNHKDSGKFIFSSSQYSSNITTFQLFIMLNSIMLQLGFVLLALIWEYDFPPFMVLIIAILNDGNISTSSSFTISSS